MTNLSIYVTLNFPCTTFIELIELLINKLCIKSKCIEIYEGFRTSVQQILLE